MTCDGLDIIAKSLPVPRDVQVGDWMCIGGMGAYTYGCRSNFNGMKTTEKIFVWPTNLESPVVHRQGVKEALTL